MLCLFLQLIWMSFSEMISLIYPLFFYMFSIMMFLFSLEPFIFWMLMEINLISFIFLMYCFDLKKSAYQEDYIFFYFVIQSMFSLLFLISICFSESYHILSDLIFLVAISGKLGIFPFYFWVLKVCMSMNSLIFVLLISIQKIPMILIFFNFSSIVILPFLLMSSIFGSFMIFYSSNLLHISIFSSIGSSFWLYLLYLESYFFYFIFFFFYTVALYQVFSNKSLKKIYIIMFFMFVCGLPPFSLFFFKIYISSGMASATSSVIFLLFWMMSMMSLIGYTKFFYQSFFDHNSIYLKHKLPFSKSLFFMVIFFFSFFSMV